MYKCNDCGWVFDEPYEYEERDVGYKADWCPECHSDDITEVKECVFCGELTPVYDLTYKGYCPACVKATARKFDIMLLSHFEPEELEILEEGYEIYPINSKQKEAMNDSIHEGTSAEDSERSSEMAQ